MTLSLSGSLIYGIRGKASANKNVRTSPWEESPGTTTTRPSTCSFRAVPITLTGDRDGRCAHFRTIAGRMFCQQGYTNSLTSQTKVSLNTPQRRSGAISSSSSSKLLAVPRRRWTNVQNEPPAGWGGRDIAGLPVVESERAAPEARAHAHRESRYTGRVGRSRAVAGWSKA